MQGNEAALVTLGVPDIEHARLEIHIGPGQLERFGDAQSGCCQEAEESPAGGRAQPAGWAQAVGRFEETLQFLGGIDMRHQASMGWAEELWRGHDRARISEPFHLFVHDVLPDPYHPDHAYVRIFHPEEGLAPPDWLDAKGKPIKCNRAAYLKGKHGLMPRNLYYPTSAMHAGWKGNVVEADGKFMPVFWCPTGTGELFMKLWVLYMTQRSRLRCDHPFAFVTETGKPYAINDFMGQHARAVERIGLVVAKMLGTSAHGHRHSYGQRITDYGLDPLARKKALHHKSLQSQVVYTEPDMQKVNRMIEAASQRMDSGAPLVRPDFSSYGFEDIDPLGLLTGRNPKLRRL